MEVFTNVLDQVKVPTANDNIYSEECVFSFDNPVRKCKKLFAIFGRCNFVFVCFDQESENGLYVSLTSFLGFGKDYVERYYQKTKHAVFLHIKRDKIEVNFIFAVSRLLYDDFAIKAVFHL
jgi:ubiquitin carboxyl-terminal hydrolase 5/13